MSVGAFGNLQSEIELPQREVACRHVGYQSRNDRLLCPLIGKQGGTRRLGRAAITSPEVRVPRCRCHQRALRNFVGGDRPDLRTLLAGDVSTTGDGWKLI